jgi:hypothetical protein
MNCERCGHSRFSHHANLGLFVEECWRCMAEGKECQLPSGTRIIAPQIAKAIAEARRRRRV